MKGEFNPELRAKLGQGILLIFYYANYDSLFSGLGMVNRASVYVEYFELIVNIERIKRKGMINTEFKYV